MQLSSGPHPSVNNIQVESCSFKDKRNPKKWTDAYQLKPSLQPKKEGSIQTLCFHCLWHRWTSSTSLLEKPVLLNTFISFNHQWENQPDDPAPHLQYTTIHLSHSATRLIVHQDLRLPLCHQSNRLEFSDSSVNNLRVFWARVVSVFITTDVYGPVTKGWSQTSKLTNVQEGFVLLGQYVTYNQLKTIITETDWGCHASVAKIRLHSPSWRNSEVSCCYGDLLLKMFFSLYLLTSAFGLSSNRDLLFNMTSHIHKQKCGVRCVSGWAISSQLHNLFYL